MEPTVTILLAAYNGEKYISDQIESILNQSYKNWRLIIQDDCSTDNTCLIAGKYVNNFKDRVLLIQNKIPSGSAKNNFFSMLQHAKTDYIMTCDQDDIWVTDKISTTLSKMLEFEALDNSSKPVLIHTDVKVVDHKLNILANSLFSYQKLDNSRDKLNNLLVQNIVTGCTMMVNRALIEKVGNIPKMAVMHDWWLALIACTFGHIGFISEPLVLYRQHNDNEVGAKDVGNIRYLVNRILSADSIKSTLSGTYTQAKAFVDTYRGQLTEKQLEILKAYCSLPESNKIERIKTISRYDFWKSGKLRRFGQILFT